MMSNSPGQMNKLVRRVESEIQNLKVDKGRNRVELLLAHHEFDVNKTIDSFKDKTSEDLLDEWKVFSRKKKRNQSTTSTPKAVQKADGSPSTSHQSPRSQKVTDSSPDLVDNKHLDRVDEVLMKKIDSYERSIKEYELKMESCHDNGLCQYYITSATQLRQQIGFLFEKACQGNVIDQIAKLSKKVDALLDQNNDRIRLELDCWDTSSNRTREEQEDFKNKLIVFYQCGTNETKRVKCMIMGKFFDRAYVRASHIWKSATNGIGLPSFHLREGDVHNERNGLLLFESIETNFDRKKLCFVYDPFAQVLRLKILCDRLRPSYLVTDESQRKKFDEHRTFQHIDNAVLVLPKDVFPFRRLLNWHGRCAYRTAKRNGWITTDEHLEDFFHLSDLISLPGDENDE